MLAEQRIVLSHSTRGKFSPTDQIEMDLVLLTLFKERTQVHLGRIKPLPNMRTPSHPLLLTETRSGKLLKVRLSTFQRPRLVVLASSFVSDFLHVYSSGIATPLASPAQVACQEPKPILLNTVGNVTPLSWFCPVSDNLLVRAVERGTRHIRVLSLLFALF